MHQKEMQYYPIVVDDMKLNNVISMDSKALIVRFICRRMGTMSLFQWIQVN